MKTKPNLGFWSLWNLSFGFFGVQIAYALQSANVSRIFATIGASPLDLSYFWILPPLMGLIVPPLIGVLSDNTWCRLGRRLPYMVLGVAITAIVMCLLPNAGSLGLTVSMAIIFGLCALLVFDAAINTAMQPFKMLVGDMVNEKQKPLAFSIQSYICSAGGIVGFVLPFLLTWLGIESTADEGEVPQSVVYSFYVGAAILLACAAYSFVKTKEWDPREYNLYHGVAENNRISLPQITKLLKNAPKTFWTVSVVQFFCWFAFLFMWTYVTGSVAELAFNTPTVESISGISDGKVVYNGNYLIINDSVVMIDHGRALAADVITTDSAGNTHSIPAYEVVVNGDTIVRRHRVLDVEGLPKAELGAPIAGFGDDVRINGEQVESAGDFVLQDYIPLLSNGCQLTIASIAARDNFSGALVVEDAKTATIKPGKDFHYEKSVVLNTQSPQYNAAGNWVGILFAVQALASVLWAVILPRIGTVRFSYFLSLVLGGVGFVSAAMLTNQYMLIISFMLIGCAWAAMLAWPFTILTNSLKNGNIGTYLGLFNCSICIPQIIGALAGGWLLSMFGSDGELAPQHYMMLIAGISLFIGSLCVPLIKDDSESPLS